MQMKTHWLALNSHSCSCLYYIMQTNNKDYCYIMISISGLLWRSVYLAKYWNQSWWAMNSAKVSTAWMDSRLPVKMSQALAEHVVTLHFSFSTSTNVLEPCKGNILIRLKSASLNEDWSTSMVDASISEMEKGLAHALLCYSVRMVDWNPF